MAQIFSTVEVNGKITIVPRNSDSADPVPTAPLELDLLVTRQLNKNIILEADPAEAISLHDLAGGANFLYWSADGEVTAVITTVAGAAEIVPGNLFMLSTLDPVTALTMQRATGVTTRVVLVAAQV